MSTTDIAHAERPAKVGRWSESALRVLNERYLFRNKLGEVVETPEGMCWRVATDIARAELMHGVDEATALKWAERFYDLMVEQKFLPNSPTLMNAGKGNGLQYSACYVLPVGDSMVEIFDAIKNAALIHQSGGGTGFAFSRLRPAGSLVRSSGGKASGPVSFLRVFNAATEAVKQGGTRRGANMGILRVDHPDIEEFITCKLDGGITNFNISVAATDAFMRAVAEDTEYDILAQPGWPDEKGGHYKGGEVIGRKRARDVFQKIVESAWRSGDPGMIFIDRMNDSPANPTPALGLIEATNPCGEQPLLPNEACKLGSINLIKFVKPLEQRAGAKNGHQPERHPGIDWDELERVVRISVRFLDDVIDVNPYPLPQITEMVKGNRRIGLGVMGWADMLFALGIPYDSEEALDLAHQVMGFINEIGHDESARLAEERGPFPNWEQSIYANDRPLRNATVTTIAPTGTLSIIANTSSGIEPIFALAFSHVVEDRRLTFVDPILEQVARERGFYSEELMEKVAETGTLHGVKDVPEDIRRVFVTAHEVDPEWHVRMQAAFQAHTDNAVSKTINLRNEATIDDVARAYQLAYEAGCLGITVFRDGCKGTQVLHAGTKAAEEKGEEKPQVSQPSPDGYYQKKPRPRALPGTTYRWATPLGTAYITVNTNGGDQPFEVFLNVGKAGSDVAAVSEALGRLISLILRLPSSLPPRERLEEVVEQLSGIGGGRPLGIGPNRVRSLPDAIAQALAEYLGESPHTDQPVSVQEAPIAQLTLPLEAPKGRDLCPVCGQATLVFEEGCKKCLSCGYSEC
ncbi:MAG: vitamin B12-dependent ribonucleotide reductase [Anaerolineae bacterium]|nr:vitamin B12-dependent ribonucleotide reductase [Anaerolineae bacterium]